MEDHFFNPEVIYLLPGTSSTYSEQLQNCLKQLGDYLTSKGLQKDRVIRQTIFFGAGDNSEYQSKQKTFRDVLKSFYPAQIPATAYIAQLPEFNGRMSLEVYIACDSSDELKIRHIPIADNSYTVIESSGYKEIYAAGLNSGCNSGIYKQATTSFTIMKEILDNEDLTFQDVVRQWNYIEEITKVSGNNSIKQNYQIFNDVRTGFYGSLPFKNGYPSATGIGTSTGGVTLDFVAVKPGYYSVIPVKNPDQIDAHEYSDRVLVGEGIDKQAGKTTPKFERGKLLMLNKTARVYVSGTAAVVGEDSFHTGDVEKQAMITIDNIRKLLSENNLSDSGLHFDLNNTRFAYVRTYVKDRNDVAKVKEICEKHLKSNNFQYLVSDICRDNLLVEIEGTISPQ